MKDIRKLPYRQASKLVPEELLDKKFSCPSCKTEIAVPWLDKLSFPQQPIKPYMADGHWVPIGMQMLCSNESCQKEFNVSVPILPNTNRWTLYGDEAGRYIKTPNIKYSPESLHFFCITLVGLEHKKHESVRRKIEKLKLSIVPLQNPDSWQHHFTEIWASNSTSDKFKLKDKNAKIVYAKKFAKVIREARPELVSFNISGCIVIPETSRDRKQYIKSQKESLFSQSILTTLQQFRSRHKSVTWVFDNVKDTTGGLRTEGWAAECFLGLQYTRLFTWLSSGAAITEPEFIPPGSHFLLEVADFISYCVARDFEKSLQESASEFPSSLLGEGFFQGTLSDGTVEYRWHHGLPLQEFYGISNITPHQ